MNSSNLVLHTAAANLTTLDLFFAAQSAALGINAREVDLFECGVDSHVDV